MFIYTGRQRTEGGNCDERLSEWIVINSDLKHTNLLYITNKCT